MHHPGRRWSKGYLSHVLNHRHLGPREVPNPPRHELAPRCNPTGLLPQVLVILSQVLGRHAGDVCARDGYVGMFPTPRWYLAWSASDSVMRFPLQSSLSHGLAGLCGRASRDTVSLVGLRQRTPWSNPGTHPSLLGDKGRCCVCDICVSRLLPCMLDRGWAIALSACLDAELVVG